MSDCHRGDGSWADEFSKNQNLFTTALNYYYNNDFTYIELGDGDELWENKNICDIIEAHNDVFWILSKFIKDGRFYSLFGNHDIVKRENFLYRNLSCKDFNKNTKEYLFLFKKLLFHEGIVLKHVHNDIKVFLVHGHQVDFFNNQLWRLSSFLVKHFWRPLQLYGIKDPTSTAKNNAKKKSVEDKLSYWAKRNNQILVAGHTHRPMFPDIAQPLCFNVGSCVHPRCITGIEIEYGSICLIKWSIKVKSDGTLFVSRNVLAGPKELNSYFDLYKLFNEELYLIGMLFIILSQKKS
jgi:UDP-2,3-diacylglucosamine pyrophosphatase LpxH